MGQVRAGQAGRAARMGRGELSHLRGVDGKGPVCPVVWGQAVEALGLAVIHLGEDLEGQARGTYLRLPQQRAPGGSVMMAAADAGPARAHHQRAVHSYGETGAPLPAQWLRSQVQGRF